MSADLLAVAAIAFGAQLAVLPGEKVQFIIAGLSTRYNPLLVVSAAGTAFAGWTAVEILVGRGLSRALPGVVLDAFTGVLFVVFAVLLYRSAPDPVEAFEGEAAAEAGGAAGPPEPDGGAVGVSEAQMNLDVDVLGVEVPDRFGKFLPIFAMMAAGEFGDKTQLITIGLAAQFGAHPGIWIGEMAAIVPVSLANAYFFHTFSHRFDVRKAHFLGAALFAFFGVDTLQAIVTGVSAWERIVGAISGLIVGAVPL